MENKKNDDELKKLYKRAFKAHVRASGSSVNDFGYYCYSKKKYQLAIQSYKKARDAGFADQYTYRRLAQAYVNIGKPDDALKIYQEAVKANNDYVSIIKYVAEEMKKNEEIGKRPLQQLYQYAANLEAAEASTYISLGQAFLSLKEYTRAIDAYEKAFRLDPDNPRNDSTYFNLGQKLGRLGKYSEAIAIYKKAIKQNPENKAVKRNLAELELIIGHFSHAFVQANELLESKKLSAGYRLPMKSILVSSLVFQGKEPEAHAELKELVKSIKNSKYNTYTSWSYKLTKDFIGRTKKLREEKKNLLIEFIDILASRRSSKTRELIKTFEEKYLKGKEAL